MEYNFKCLIDDSGFKTLEHLHLYLRKLKIKQSEYYEKFLPRQDLGTGEVIKYKDYEQYFSTDFLNKNSLKRYLKQNPEKGKEWAINWLKKRKGSKGLVYAPTQVELRSLMCPTMHYYESIGGYNKIVEEIGYKIKFNNTKLKYSALNKDTVIITDTREQKPLSIEKYKTKIECVKYGDYALEGRYDKKIYVERKSIADFVGSFGKDLGRLKREIQRAKDDNGYLVVLVENDLNTALSFNYLPQLKFSKVTPSHIFKNVRDILHEFDNVQFLFVDGRKEAARAIIKIFELGESVKNIDLEFCYEFGSLKLGEI
jgi:hypothetical protein